MSQLKVLENQQVSETETVSHSKYIHKQFHIHDALRSQCRESSTRHIYMQSQSYSIAMGWHDTCKPI